MILFGVTLMAVLGVSSVTPAFPAVIKALDISKKEVGALVSIFTLPGIFLTPITGALSDRFGRKKILVPSIVVFAVAGFLCGFARSFELLLVLRFVQGAGAASLGSLNVTLIGDVFQGRERAAAMGYNSSVLSVGTASYPVIGGALATFGWYYPFFLPIVGLVVAGFALFALDNPEPQGKQKFIKYLKDAFREIRNKEVIGVFIASLATFIILYGPYITFLPLLLSEKFGANSLTIGLTMSAMSGSTAITSSQLGRLSRRISERNLMKIGFVLYALSLATIPFVGSIWALLIPIVVFGIAQGLNLPSLMTVLSGLAPLKFRGIFMSANGSILRLGQTLGPTIMGLVVIGFGFEGVFFAGAALAVIVLFILYAVLTEGSSSRDNGK